MELFLKTILYLRALTGKVPSFWEHLMFDMAKNWILGGHDGGSAGFDSAADPSGVKLRNTMYVEFKNSPPAPKMGVVPEFIQRPGRVTWMNLFRDREGYAMRVGTGESVDTAARPVHHEHMILKPDVPLGVYFERIACVGVEHHFAVAYGDLAADLERLAELLDMPFVDLTAPS